MTAIVPKRNRPSGGIVLNIHWVAYAFAVAAGVVSSGAIGTLWALASDEAPGLYALERADLLTPFRGVVFVFSAPTLLIISSTYRIFKRPLTGLVMLMLGLALSFLQGVVLLTQFFGVM